MEGRVIDHRFTVVGWDTDVDGFRYVKVNTPIGPARHYPQAFGLPPLIIDPMKDRSEDCMFLEGEACYIY